MKLSAPFMSIVAISSSFPLKYQQNYSKVKKLAVVGQRESNKRRPNANANNNELSALCFLLSAFQPPAAQQQLEPTVMAKENKPVIVGNSSPNISEDLQKSLIWLLDDTIESSQPN